MKTSAAALRDAARSDGPGAVRKGAPTPAHDPPVVIRLPWWSPQSLVFLLPGLATAAHLVTARAHPLAFSAPLLWFVVWWVRIRSPYVFLGSRMMGVPAQGFWNRFTGLKPHPGGGVWVGGLIGDEFEKDEGRMVRLDSVERWEEEGGRIRLVLRAGDARTFPLSGIRGRDRRTLRSYLLRHVGPAGAGTAASS